MNLLGVIRWNCIFNERLFMNMTTYLSSYKYRSHEYVCNSDVQKEKRMWYWAGEVFFTSRIDNIGLKSVFDWQLAKGHYVKLGMDMFRYLSKPVNFNLYSREWGDILFKEKQPDNEISHINVRYAYKPDEANFYIEDEFRYNDWFMLQIGGRYTLYRIGTMLNQRFNPYVQLRLKIFEKGEFYWGYSSTVQYLNLMPSLDVLFSFSANSWLVMDKNILPKRGQFLDMTYAYNSQCYYFSLSAFYRTIYNRIIWDDLSKSAIVSQRWNNALWFAEGRSRGLELMVGGNLNGYKLSMNYTLSWSNDRSKLYNNKWHAASNDSRHNINLSAYKRFFNEKFDVALMWGYRTGFPYTQITDIYQPLQPDGGINDWIPGNLQRNNAKMYSTHYLNMNLNWNFSLGRKYKGTLSAGVYNLYFNHNPYFVMRLKNLEQRKIEYREVSISPVLPYIAFIVKY